MSCELPFKVRSSVHSKACVPARARDVKTKDFFYLCRVEDLLEPPEEPVPVAVAGLGVDEDDEGGPGEGPGQVPGGGGGWENIGSLFVVARKYLYCKNCKL